MEIRRIEDRSIWETCLKKFSYTTPFLSWEWGEFEKQLGNNFEMWGIFDQNEAVGLLPMNFVEAKRGKYLHLRHGPLIDWNDKHVVNLANDFIISKSRERGAYLLRISPLISKTLENEKLFKNLGYLTSMTHSSDAELTVYIDLKKTEDEILGDMRKTTRQLIKKAEKIGVVVNRYVDLSRFNDFMLIFEETVKRNNWTAYSRNYIEKEFNIFAGSNKAFMFVANFEDKAVGASIFIVHENQVVYHHSGSLSEYRDIPAMYLLHWEAIKFFKNMGLEIYNFWGVCHENDKKHPWYGLSLFKRGFSKNEMEFLHAQDYVVNPLGYLTRFYEWLEAKRRGYK